ncbi:unnamed protein product [marine sediment metagenome]|uniref:Uncharacterized protein n=1 Tax=marine sediment metagenome TaxID=412755 RepID=X1TLN9_9ZZZZ
MYKNIKELLVDATKLPVAIEAKLPAGAPVISTMLLDAADKIPAVPDFPMEIPDLPAPPELPELPELPGAPELGRRRYVTGVEVRPVAPVTPRPAAPVVARKPLGEEILS